MIRAPNIPKMTPMSSKIEIIFPFQIAYRTTKEGLLIADIAVTGPAGPPLVYATFREVIPSEAVFPQINPTIIKSH